MRMIWIAVLLTLAPAGQAQGQGQAQAQAQARERPPESEADLLYRDGALIYGPGYDEAYRAGLDEGYEAGFDDGRQVEAERRAEDRSRDDGRVRTTVTTAGHGAGRTRFVEVPAGGRSPAAGRKARARRR